MQCKHHPDRRAGQLCTSCGIPLCDECSEEGMPGKYFCFECAIQNSLSQAGTTMQDQKNRASKKRKKRKKKWGLFQYFVIVCTILILAMWAFILFGGEEPPAASMDLSKQPRILLFMVDSALKRFAHYEGNIYPEKITDLIPKYLSFNEGDLFQLTILSYERVTGLGYHLSLSDPRPGELDIVISPKGIEYQLVPGGGAT